jgi:DNA (cytosine-5)-methyltransferase 1
MGEALGLTGFETHSQRTPETAKGGNRWVPADEPSATISAISAPHIRVIGAGTNFHGPGRAHERTERDITDEPAPTVTAEQVGNAGPWIEVVNPYLSKPSPTVSAVSECKGSGPGGSPEKMQRASDALFLGTGRRRLTVEECAKLQGFPDDHPWQGSKSSRYKQVGNAVVPLMAEVVGRAILETDRGGR